MDTNQSQGKQPTDQDNHPISCSPPSPTQYEKARDVYKKVIKEETKKAEAKRLTRKVQADSRSEVVCNVRRAEKWLRGTSNEYYFLDSCISIHAARDLKSLSETGKKNVNDSFSGFTKSFDATLKILKESKKQVGKVYELAKKLGDAINESCNSEEVKLLKQCFDKDKSKDQLDASVRKILRLARHVHNKADDLSESAVKTAGINAFINVGSLTTFIDDIKKTGDGFTQNVKSSIKSLQKDSEESAKSLTKAIEDLSDSLQEKYTTRNYKESWDKASAYIGGSLPDTCKPIKPLAEEAACSFNEEKQESGESSETATAS